MIVIFCLKIPRTCLNIYIRFLSTQKKTHIIPHVSSLFVLINLLDNLYHYQYFAKSDNVLSLWNVVQSTFPKVLKLARQYLFHKEGYFNCITNMTRTNYRRNFSPFRNEVLRASYITISSYVLILTCIYHCNYFIWWIGASSLTEKRYFCWLVSI